MTLFEFRMLDENEKQEAIFNGVQIAERTDDEHWILLYQLDNLYVEVYYHQEKKVIVKYTPFKASQRLSPYLRQIDISAILPA
jgi:hypothetical protein